MINRFFFHLLILFLIAVNAMPANAQSLAPSDALYAEVAHMDSLLFNGFNSHNLDVMKKLFDKDLEFYHDKGGLTNYEQNITAFQQNFAANKNVHRELVPGSMEVYPIKDFGAVQMASHRFCNTENGVANCGTYKFVHVWKRTPEGLKLARVVSVGH